MPFAPHVFRHTPALRGRITPPDESEMRFGYDRFDELDAQAIEEGWPDGWRSDPHFWTRSHDDQSPHIHTNEGDRT